MFDSAGTDSSNFEGPASSLPALHGAVLESDLGRAVGVERRRIEPHGSDLGLVGEAAAVVGRAVAVVVEAVAADLDAALLGHRADPRAIVTVAVGDGLAVAVVVGRIDRRRRRAARPRPGSRPPARRSRRPRRCSRSRACRARCSAAIVAVALALDVGRQLAVAVVVELVLAEVVVELHARVVLRRRREVEELHRDDEVALLERVGDRAVGERADVAHDVVDQAVAVEVEALGDVRDLQVRDHHLLIAHPRHGGRHAARRLVDEGRVGPLVAAPPQAANPKNESAATGTHESDCLIKLPSAGVEAAQGKPEHTAGPIRWSTV